MELILKYFPSLSENQQRQFEALYKLYSEWNAKINVISRKDIDNLYLHHVLHSLAIAKIISFRQGTKILDFGTGGGFPGIPLAIMFPDVQFKMIDGTGKKILVVNEITKAVGLNNCRAEHLRGENEKELFDFVVCRAVMPLPDLVKVVKKNISKKNNNAIANGLICLKGGDITDEIMKFRNIVEITEISSFFHEDWFTDKHIIYLPL